MNGEFPVQERRGAWKILLPWDKKLTFHVNDDAGVEAALARNYTPTANNEKADIVYNASPKQANYFIHLGAEVDILPPELKLRERFLPLPNGKNPRIFISLASRASLLDGLKFHTPASLKARLGVWVLKIIASLGLDRLLHSRALHIYSRVDLRQSGIYGKLHEITTSPPEYIHIYNGSDALKRKITVSVPMADASSFVGKVAETAEGCNAIAVEIGILEKLAKTEIADFVPQVAGYADSLAQEGFGWSLLAVTPSNVKLRRIRQMNDKKLDFLRKLSQLDRQDTMLGEYLKIFAFSDGAGRKLIEELELFGNKTLTLSLAHGDFAPWNIYERRSGLWVYDWEDTQILPVGSDLFHYLYRSRAFTGRWCGAQKLWQEWVDYYPYLGEYLGNIAVIFALGIAREYAISGKNREILDECATLAGVKLWE